MTKQTTDTDRITTNQWLEEINSHQSALVDPRNKVKNRQTLQAQIDYCKRMKQKRKRFVHREIKETIVDLFWDVLGGADKELMIKGFHSLIGYYVKSGDISEEESKQYEIDFSNMFTTKSVRERYDVQ